MDPEPAKTTRWWRTSFGCPNWTRCARRRPPRARPWPGRDDELRHAPATAGRASRIGVDRRRQLRALAEQSARRYGDHRRAASSATTWTTACRRQRVGHQAGPSGRATTLTRKYAADIDGVLEWAESRASGWPTWTSPRRVGGLAASGRRARTRIGPGRSRLSRFGRKAAKRLAKAVTAELSGLAMADADSPRGAMTSRADRDPAALTLPSGALAVRRGWHRQVEFGFAAHRGMTCCRWRRARPVANCPG